jgi:RNA polymerase sigma factor (sigma-70 family)
MAELKLNGRSCHSFKEYEYWRQVKSGEKSGLEGLYEMYAYELMAFGLRIKSDRSLVKDCIQELFVDIWRYRSNNKKVNNIKMYIFRSLSNKINKEITHIKKRQLNEQLVGYDDFYVQDHLEPDDPLFSNEESTNSKLMAALDALPPRQKEVITHVFFKNLSNDQISAVMGINVQSVYTLTWKAICNLRKHFNMFLILLLL